MLVKARFIVTGWLLKEVKLTKKPFTGCILFNFLIQIQMLASKVLACTESEMFGFKSDTALLFVFLNM